jgi:outer membrane protein assembly factor BamB
LIFVCWEHGITSVDPATGRVNWERDVFTKGHMETTIASPIVAGDLILGISGWLGVNYEVVAVHAPGREDKGAHVYRLDKVAPLVPTPVVKDDLLFLWNDRGVISCAHAGTGEIHWRERVAGTFYGSPVCAGKNLYCMSREGEVVVVAASRRFELLARNALGEGSHSTPAVANSAMYLRTFSHLVAIGRQ